MKLSGEVVYIFAYDIAYDMKREPVTSLLGQPVVQFEVGISRHSPKQLFFYRPQTVRLPPVERVGPQGPVTVSRAVKLFPVGAVSISVRVPFKDQRLADLVAWHFLTFDGVRVEDEVKTLAEQVQNDLGSHIVRPVQELANEEAYTVFCIDQASQSQEGGPSAETWLLERRREVAALLMEERDAAHLSEQEADESTGINLSYHDRDIAVIDWDAALVIDEPKNFEETLHIMELANVQLAELETYDRTLDGTLEASYRDLRARRPGVRGEVLQSLREIRIDLARLSDELSNITKFFGDWHLARIYQGLSARFHLAEWTRTIDQKLQTLDELYQLLKQEQLNRWMLMLEVAIVLLFIIDLIILVFGLVK